MSAPSPLKRSKRYEDLSPFNLTGNKSPNFTNTRAADDAEYFFFSYKLPDYEVEMENPSSKVDDNAEMFEIEMSL
ncbi:hypothetical protein QTN25_003336 [Entamoeba marina]